MDELRELYRLFLHFWFMVQLRALPVLLLGLVLVHVIVVLLAFYLRGFDIYSDQWIPTWVTVALPLPIPIAATMLAFAAVRHDRANARERSWKEHFGAMGITVVIGVAITALLGTTTLLIVGLMLSLLTVLVRRDYISSSPHEV